MYKYSVIIPIYNAEATLDRCINSLLSQNYDSAEIILINDGSSDKSGEICEQYARVSSRVKYILQENCGVSRARNNGISVASGRYILFVDSDDYVANGYFEQLDHCLKLHDSDWLIFSEYHCKASNITEIKHQPFFTDESDDLFDKISDLMCRKVISGPVTKIYKKSIIDKYQICFPEGVSIAEDRTFNIKYALHIKSLRVIDVPLYYVSLDNETSLSRRKKEHFGEQAEIVRKDIDKAIAECNLTDNEKQYFIDALNFGECRVAYTYAKMFWQANDKRGVRIKKIKQLCRDINSRHYSYPKTRYCKLITLPVRLELAWMIDAMAWKLTH